MPEPSSKNRYFRSHLFLFALILLLGIVLRVVVHLNGPLNFDEVCSWAFARKMPFMNMWQAALSDPSPPLFYAIVHWIIRLLGDSPALMRLPSLVPGVLILPITYWCMGKGGFDKSDRLAAMLIVAVSSMLVHYSQELRAYSMLAFFGVLATGLMHSSFITPSLNNHMLYAGSIFILSYTHRYGFLLIAAHALCMVVFRKWKILVIWAATTSLMLLLLLLQVKQGDFYYSEALDRVTSMGSIAVLLNTLNIGTIQLCHIFGGQPVADAYYPNNAINIAISLAGLMTFSAIFASGLRAIKNFTPAQRQWMLLLGICTVCPSIIALIGGTRLAPKPQWLLRGLIYIWPLYYMLAVALCSRVRYKKYLIASMMIINCLTLYPYYAFFSRGIHAVALEKLSDRTAAQDLIVAYPWYFYEVVNYYYRGPAVKAAFSDEKGWIDPEAIRASDTPFDARAIPPSQPPAVTGDVYFFWWIREGDCIKPFGNNNLFVYDMNAQTQWRKIKPAGR